MARNSFFLFALVIVFVAGEKESARYISYKNDVVSPLTQGKCKAGGEKLINLGETWYREDYCEKVRCFRTGSFVHMEVRGCTSVAPLNPNCTVKSHHGIYPDCCDGEIVCSEQPEPKSDVEMAEMIRALLENETK